MQTEPIIEHIREKLGAAVLKVEIKSSTRATVDILPEKILPAAEMLHFELGLRFIIATALHTRKGFEIFYHFSMDETGLILNIRVLLSQTNPEIESLSNMFSASNWIEREMHELFGINFRNHPNQEKLISEGNWAEGVYPYRKDFT
jgi:NADH-quinone oxidoreductase subunit C